MKLPEHDSQKRIVFVQLFAEASSSATVPDEIQIVPCGEPPTESKRLPPRVSTTIRTYHEQLKLWSRPNPIPDSAKIGDRIAEVQMIWLDIEGGKEPPPPPPPPTDWDGKKGQVPPGGIR